MEIDYNKCDRELSKAIKREINQKGLRRIKHFDKTGEAIGCPYVSVDGELHSNLLDCPVYEILSKNKTTGCDSTLSPCTNHWRWFSYMYHMKIKENNKEW